MKKKSSSSIHPQRRLSKSKARGPTDVNKKSPPDSVIERQDHPRPTTPTFIQFLHRFFRDQLRMPWITSELLRQAKRNELPLSMNGRCSNNYVGRNALWMALYRCTLWKLAGESSHVWTQCTTLPSITSVPLSIAQEIVISSFYSWEYSHASFFASNTKQANVKPQGRVSENSAQVLFFALSWFMGKFHLIQKNASSSPTIHRGLNRLPPYPTTVTLTRAQLQSMASKSISHGSRLLLNQKKNPCRSSVQDHIQNIQHLNGRIRFQMQECQSWGKTFEKLKSRIHRMQHQHSTTTTDISGNEDNVLSSYELRLLQHPKELHLHFQVLTEKLAEFQYEKQFFQWVGGSVSKGSISKRPIYNNDSEEEHANEVNPVFDQVVKCQNQVRAQLADLRQLHLQLGKQWKMAKATLPSLQYHQLKHTKFKVMSNKIDDVLPNIFQMYMIAQQKHQRKGKPTNSIEERQRQQNHDNQNEITSLLSFNPHSTLLESFQALFQHMEQTYPGDLKLI